MTMFQILTQKGWWEIMHHTMIQSKRFFPLVAVYFISYHLFVTLVRLKSLKYISHNYPILLLYMISVFMLYINVVFDPYCYVYKKINPGFKFLLLHFCIFVSILFKCCREFLSFEILLKYRCNDFTRFSGFIFICHLLEIYVIFQWLKFVLYILLYPNSNNLSPAYKCIWEKINLYGAVTYWYTYLFFCFCFY